MSTISFDSNATAKTARVLTRSSGVVNLMVDTEHTEALPSTFTIRSELPKKGYNGVSRKFVRRSRDLVIDAGTERERVAPLIVKMEISKPTGVSDAQIVDLINDLIGYTATTHFDNLRQFGTVDV